MPYAGNGAREPAFQHLVRSRIYRRKCLKVTNSADKPVHPRREAADQPVGVGHNGLEYRLHVRWRAGDHLQDVGRRGLPLQRLPGLIEQPGIFDRDQGLVAEGFGQHYFALAEYAGAFSGQREHANTFSLAHQRQVVPS